MTQTMAPRRPKATEQAVETPPPALDPPALLADLHIDTDKMMLEGLDTSSGPLFSVADGANGVFADAAGSFPVNSWGGSDYGVDAVVR